MLVPMSQTFSEGRIGFGKETLGLQGCRWDESVATSGLEITTAALLSMEHCCSEWDSSVQWLLFRLEY